MTFPSQSFFLYLNIDVFPAAWVAYRGQLITAANYGTKEFRPLSYWPISLLKDKRILRVQKELALEQIRRRFYPTQVSRLHGIYLWRDEASARRGERWRDKEGNHFHPDYLVEVGFTYSCLSRVDTNWIDRYLLPDSVPLERGNDDWMHSYWRGDAFPDDEPLWEYIAEGRGLVYGQKLRTQAYSKVAVVAPMSLGQLELGRIAVELESDLYHAAPFVRFVAGSRFRVDYYLDVRDQNAEFMKRAGIYIEQTAQKDQTLINWKALNLLRGETKTPNLSHLGFTFDCQEYSVNEQTLIGSIVSQHDGSVWYGITGPPLAAFVPELPDPA